MNYMRYFILLSFTIFHIAAQAQTQFSHSALGGNDTIQVELCYNGSNLALASNFDVLLLIDDTIIYAYVFDNAFVFPNVYNGKKGTAIFHYKKTYCSLMPNSDDISLIRNCGHIRIIHYDTPKLFKIPNPMESTFSAVILSAIDYGYDFSRECCVVERNGVFSFIPQEDCRKYKKTFKKNYSVVKH